MKKIIFNLKSYFNLDEMNKYKKELEQLKIDNYELIVLPPIIYLTLFKDFKHKVGTQNFFSYNYGSFTGEVNLESLKYMGIKHTFIGHSERKRLMEESGTMIKEKLFKSLNSKFNTILCVGELKKMRSPFSYIKKELNYLLKEIEGTNIKYISIAYEPSWAVGSGEIQDIERIRKTIDKIRVFLEKKYDEKIEVYYGGSIDESTVKSVLEITDGIVLGASSRNIEKVRAILKQI